MWFKDRIEANAVCSLGIIAVCWIVVMWMIPQVRDFLKPIFGLALLIGGFVFLSSILGGCLYWFDRKIHPEKRE